MSSYYGQQGAYAADPYASQQQSATAGSYYSSGQSAPSSSYGAGGQYPSSYPATSYQQGQQGQYATMGPKTRSSSMTASPGQPLMITPNGQLVNLDPSVVAAVGNNPLDSWRDFFSGGSQSPSAVQRGVPQAPQAVSAQPGMGAYGALQGSLAAASPSAGYAPAASPSAAYAPAAAVYSGNGGYAPAPGYSTLGQ